MNNQALQDIIAPDGICFGCGPCNKHGLQIKSYWDTDNEHVIMRYLPDDRYVDWPSLLYGGIISCLIDCHFNWTAMAHHYRAEERDPGISSRFRHSGDLLFHLCNLLKIQLFLVFDVFVVFANSHQLIWVGFLIAVLCFSRQLKTIVD